MDWERYFAKIATFVAEKSKDTTKVGALLIGDNNELLLSAYNGPPIGVNDCEDRFVRPKKYLYASHAEQNLISFAARNGINTNRKRIFTTHFPCSSCARSIIQAGIKRITFCDGKTNMPDEEFCAARIMFEEAGVKIDNFAGDFE